MARYSYRYHGSHPFMSKARQAAVDRERRFLANNSRIPYLFGHTDDVAVAMRKRARDRMHTIVREQQYLKLHKPDFGNYKLNKYRRSMTKHDGRVPRRTFRFGKPGGGYRRFHFRSL